MKNRFFYCRCAMLLALLSLLSLLQFSCDLEESCLDPSADCFVAVAGSPLFVSSVPAAPGPINADFNKVRITFSKKISSITNITNKKAYSLSGDGVGSLSIDKIDLVDDTTVEIKLKGNISEGPIQLDFSKLKDRREKTLKGTTSISFTNDYKAIVTLKISNTINQVRSGASAVDILSSSDVTLTSGTDTTLTAPATGRVYIEIGSLVASTVTKITKVPNGVTVHLYYTTGTVVDSISGFTSTNIISITSAATIISITSTSSTGSTATITTPSTGGGGTITIATIGGTITTTGGTITTKYAQLK